MKQTLFLKIYTTKCPVSINYTYTNADGTLTGGGVADMDNGFAYVVEWPEDAKHGDYVTVSFELATPILDSNDCCHVNIPKCVVVKYNQPCVFTMTGAFPELTYELPAGVHWVIENTPYHGTAKITGSTLTYTADHCSDEKDTFSVTAACSDYSCLVVVYPTDDTVVECEAGVTLTFEVGATDTVFTATATGTGTTLAWYGDNTMVADKCSLSSELIANKAKSVTDLTVLGGDVTTLSVPNADLNQTDVASYIRVVATSSDGNCEAVAHFQKCDNTDAVVEDDEGYEQVIKVVDGKGVVVTDFTCVELNLTPLGGDNPTKVDNAGDLASVLAGLLGLAESNFTLDTVTGCITIVYPEDYTGSFATDISVACSTDLDGGIDIASGAETPTGRDATITANVTGSTAITQNSWTVTNLTTSTELGISANPDFSPPTLLFPYSETIEATYNVVDENECVGYAGVWTRDLLSTAYNVSGGSLINVSTATKGLVFNLGQEATSGQHLSVQALVSTRFNALIESVTVRLTHDVVISATPDFEETRSDLDFVFDNNGNGYGTLAGAGGYVGPISTEVIVLFSDGTQLIGSEDNNLVIL